MSHSQDRHYKRDVCKTIDSTSRTGNKVDYDSFYYDFYYYYFFLSLEVLYLLNIQQAEKSDFKI